MFRQSELGKTKYFASATTDQQLTIMQKKFENALYMNYVGWSIKPVHQPETIFTLYY